MRLMRRYQLGEPVRNLTEANRRIQLFRDSDIADCHYCIKGTDGEFCVFRTYLILIFDDWNDFEREIEMRRDVDNSSVEYFAEID